MATTPSPGGRVRTPPPPLHGPRHDNYEPYSPRRSTRVAAQRNTDHSFSTSRSARASTPASKQSPTFDRKRRSSFPASDSDNDAIPTQLDRLTSTAASCGMFHTPAKTPRKRSVPHGAMNRTARALFPGRPATVEEAMPTPKKARKKISNPFAIPEDGHDASSSSKIEIYTDSKDRVPTLDEDEANPFLSKNAAKPNKRRKNKAATEEEMEEAARNDEGLVYVFRGKKIFRRFDNVAESNEDEDDNLSDLEVRRKAGASANKRFTRSTIKPRLLFSSEEQKRAREAAEEADEEAVTDIEVPQPKAAVTPVKQQFRPTTPPSTGRSKRTNAEHESVDAVAAIKVTKKISAFGGWARRKAPSASTPASRKREGEPMESEPAKRTRSGAS